MKKLVVISLAAFVLGISGAFVFQFRETSPSVRPVIVEGEASCKTDSDCQLVRSKLISQCCASGERCGSLDYSQPDWIAVNVEWFTRKRQEICPKETEYQECGPALGCPVELDRRYQARCVNNACEKVRVESVGVVTSGQGTVEAPKPGGLSSYQDLPIGNLDVSKPLSIKAVVEHRSTLNGKTVTVKGFVISTLLGEAACANRGACAQPRIVLSDTTETTRDANYDLTILLPETEQGYIVGQAVTVTGVVSASSVAVVLQKTY